MAELRGHGRPKQVAALYPVVQAVQLQAVRRRELKHVRADLQGFYDSFEDYAVEYFQDNSGMALDLALSEYGVGSFPERPELSGDVVVIKDPHTGRFGMFEDFDQ